MIKSQGLAVVLRTLGNADYRTYQIGRTAGLITMWMYRMAIAWMVWDMTQSTTWLGIFGFLDQAPSFLVTPLAGALADRMDRMTLLRRSQALLMLLTVSMSLLLYFDAMGIELLAVMAFLYGTISAVQQPASHSIVPSLVPKEDLGTAFALNAMLFNVSRFAGPLMAGATIILWGTGPTIFFNTVGNGIFAVCLILMQNRHEGIGRRNQQVGKKGNLLHDVKDGLVYAARHPGLGPLLLILTFVSVLTFPLQQMLPGIADGVFGEGAQGLALMTALLGTGAMLQSAYMAQRGGVEGLTRYVGTNILIVGIAFVALTATANYWIGLASVFVVGIGMVANRIGIMTLLQNGAEPGMRGRVASFYGVLFQIGPAVGSLLIGSLGDIFGIRTMIVVVGFLTIGVWLWSLSLRSRIERSLETTVEDSESMTGTQVTHPESTLNIRPPTPG